MPSHRTTVRDNQRKRVIAHIPKRLNTSFLNIPDQLKTKTRGESCYVFDSGQKDPNRFNIFATTRYLDHLHFSKSGQWIDFLQSCLP